MALSAPTFAPDFPPHLFPLTDEEIADATYTDATDKRDALLEVWITEAGALTDDGGDPYPESTQSVYVEWKANRYVCRQMAASPASYAIEGESSGSWSADQRAVFCNEAQVKETAFNALTDTAEAGGPLPRRSVVLERTIRW